MDKEFFNIPENKIFNTLNTLLFNDTTKSKENIYSGVCCLFEQNLYNDGFDSDKFRKLYKKATLERTKENRIDCVTYLMKCVLNNPSVLHTFNVLYTGAVSPKY